MLSSRQGVRVSRAIIMRQAYTVVKVSDLWLRQTVDVSTRAQVEHERAVDHEVGFILRFSFHLTMCCFLVDTSLWVSVASIHQVAFGWAGFSRGESCR